MNMIFKRLYQANNYAYNIIIWILCDMKTKKIKKLVW